MADVVCVSIVPEGILVTTASRLTAEVAFALVGRALELAPGIVRAHAAIAVAEQGAAGVRFMCWKGGTVNGRLMEIISEVGAALAAARAVVSIMFVSPAEDDMAANDGVAVNVAGRYVSLAVPDCGAEDLARVRHLFGLLVQGTVAAGAPNARQVVCVYYASGVPAAGRPHLLVADTPGPLTPDEWWRVISEAVVRLKALGNDPCQLLLAVASTRDAVHFYSKLDSQRDTWRAATDALRAAGALSHVIRLVPADPPNEWRASVEYVGAGAFARAGAVLAGMERRLF